MINIFFHENKFKIHIIHPFDLNNDLIIYFEIESSISNSFVKPNKRYDSTTDIFPCKSN